MTTDTLKESICDALAAFVRQRPGFDYANYGECGEREERQGALGH